MTGRKRFLFPLTMVCALCLAGSIGGCSRTRPVPKAVFLIVVDTLRPDRLSCYGYRAHETPHIDRLAASGVLFERMHASASWTGPSMGTIMTSRYPTQLGMIERTSDQSTFRHRELRKQINNAIPSGAHTLAEIMRDAGFHTTAFINQAFLNAHVDYLQGFEEWCHTVGADKLVWDDPTRPSTSSSLPRGTDPGPADSALVDAFVKWLDGVGEEPRFVWLHLLRPHWPYLPSPRYMAGQPHTEDPAALYDAEIRATDDDVGRVLDAIDQRYGLEHCLIVFTSDHGEAFGEHDGFEHGHSLHAEVSHVPMILLAPGLPAGAKVDGVVRTADILPTVLDLAAVVPDTADAFVGESLRRPIEHGEEQRAGYAAGILYEGTERSWIRGGYRIMFDVAGGEHYALYDMMADPHEETDIAGLRLDLFDTMRKELNALHEQFIGDFQSGLDVAEPKSTTDEDEEASRTVRSLRALGYIR